MSIIFFLTFQNLLTKSAVNSNRSSKIFVQMSALAFLANLSTIYTTYGILQSNKDRLTINLTNAFLFAAFSCFLYHSFAALQFSSTTLLLVLSVLLPIVILCLGMIDAFYPPFFVFYNISLTLLLASFAIFLYVAWRRLTRASETIRSQLRRTTRIVRSINIMIIVTAVSVVVAVAFCIHDFVVRGDTPPSGFYLDQTFAGLVSSHTIATAFCVNYCRVLLRNVLFRQMGATGSELDSDEKAFSAQCSEVLGTKFRNDLHRIDPSDTIRSLRAQEQANLPFLSDQNFVSASGTESASLPLYSVHLSKSEVAAFSDAAADFSYYISHYFQC